MVLLFSHNKQSEEHPQQGREQRDFSLLFRMHILTFLVRDLTWQGFSKSESISFYPSFSSIAVSVPPETPTPVSAKNKSGTKALKTNGARAVPSKTFYTISGFDLSKLAGSCNKPSKPPKPTFPCSGSLLGMRR